MDEEGKRGVMHEVGLGKGEGFTHQAPQALPQGAVESLNMVGLRFGFILRELLSLNNTGISFPDVGEAMRLFVSLWNRLPQLLAGASAATADDKSDNLACAPAERQPNPAFVLAAQHEAP